MTFFDVMCLSADRKIILARAGKPSGNAGYALGSRYYGLGLMLGRYNKLDFVGHGGFVQGYLAQFSIEKNNVYAAILLRNYNRGKTNLVVDSRKLLNRLSKG